jgi:PAS domain S-box-containing protein
MTDPAPSRFSTDAPLPLQVLLIEDCEADAELLLHTLRRGGYEPRWERVDTAAGLSTALQRRQWDVITCDWVMPQFSAPAALALIRECGSDVPIIVVSGQVGEEFAVTAMKAGAHDFVSKHNLARLCPAVARELTETGMRRARKRAEEALYFSQFAMDHAGDAIFWIAPDGRILYVNHTASQRLGYSREQLLTMHVWDIDPFYPPQRWPLHWDEIKANGTLTFETQHQRRDGSSFPVETTVKHLQHRGRECALEFARDVSERKRTETELREREEALRTMIQGFDGLIYTSSQDYRIEFMNRQLIERTGREAIGERCYRVLHDREDICPWCVNERVFRGEVVRWEVQSPRDNRWYYVVNTPLRHADGSISKQALILDITDRKTMEEGLRQSEERYRQLIELSQDGIFIMDGNGMLRLANPAGCALLGYAQDELLATSVEHTYLPAERHLVAERLRQITAGKPLRYEGEALRKDGTTVSVEVSLSPLTDGRYQAVMRDITNRKRAEAEVRLSNRELKSSMARSGARRS